MAEVVVRGARVVSVLTGEAASADIGIDGSTIVAVRPPGSLTGTRMVDANGRWAVPGYVDPHLHIESSFVTPPHFAEAVLARGTTTVAADAHEVTNVLGPDGLRAFMAAGRDLPLTIAWMLPSSVPSVPGLETTGGSMEPTDVARLLEADDVVGLGEVMDAYGLVKGNPRLHAILAAARLANKPLEGHAPEVTSEALEALLRWGVDSDHSKSRVDLLIEKLRYGMFLELQAKTLSPELMQRLRALPTCPPFALCTDDISADVLAEEGHLDRIGRLAVSAGLPTAWALRAMTYEPSRRLRLYDRGILAPGRRADILLVDDLAAFRPSWVMAGGQVVAEQGQYVGPVLPSAQLPTFHHSVKVPSLTVDDVRWRLADAPDGPVALTAIEVNLRDNATHAVPLAAHVRQQRVVLPPGALLLMVMERYSGTGRRSFAPVVGLAVGNGAVATTYSHDAHNLTVLGTTDEDMWQATQAVLAADGGIAVSVNGTVAAVLPLPLAGIISPDPLPEVAAAARAVRTALERWGYHHANPFMNFSTLGLLVSPDIRLSDQGLVAVRTRTRWGEAPTVDAARTDEWTLTWLSLGSADDA